MRELLIILGTPIDDVSMAEALDRIETFVEIGRKTGKGHQIATINADFVVKSLHDAELQRILQESDMATADGMPLVWSARLLGVPLKGRVTGADMVPALAERAAERGYSIYLLGAAPGVAEQTATILRERYPALRIAGIACPSAQAIANDDQEIIEACRAAKPDILFVALGNPKQEKWIHRHAEALGVPVMMGVGGTFDFIAGVTRRAPAWMQKSGLEWLYRLVQEPRRLWKRYATDLIGFGYFFIWQWWAMRRGWLASPLLPTSEVLFLRNTVVVNIQGRLDRQNQATFAEKAERSLAMNPYLIVNLQAAEFLDSAAIGTLVALTKQARDAGGNLWLVNVPAPIVQVLRLLHLDQFFEICDDVESALALRSTSQRIPVPVGSF
ncbi:MAG: WecB/TagA/CpsF family glycosyltransferase [Caldilineaceae bacterium]|nr:WecB/TagA/CpsF family glycosyltransferase [Caldilineaceae bacterium]